MRPTDPPRDATSLSPWTIVRGGGIFDTTLAHENDEGWQLYQAGQRQFWPVEDAIDWNAPFDEDPEIARTVGAMLAFLCPGEKAAVTGASLMSLKVRSEEAKFYFAEQALEEAKHYEALRRLVPAITGQPFPEPNIWVRALYGYGVVDPDDLAFMMSNINIVGEHLANQIFRKIKPVVRDQKTIQVLNNIGRDESRHIAAGERFFASECGHLLGRSATKTARRNATTSVLLLLATYHLVGPMEKLEIDLARVMTNMYEHYDEVTGQHRGVSSAVLTVLLKFLKVLTPAVIKTVGTCTDSEGRFDYEKLASVAERIAASPRFLRRLVA